MLKYFPLLATVCASRYNPCPIDQYAEQVLINGTDQFTLRCVPIPEEDKLVVGLTTGLGFGIPITIVIVWCSISYRRFVRQEKEGKQPPNYQTSSEVPSGSDFYSVNI